MDFAFRVGRAFGIVAAAAESTDRTAHALRMHGTESVPCHETADHPQAQGRRHGDNGAHAETVVVVIGQKSPRSPSKVVMVNLGF